MTERIFTMLKVESVFGPGMNINEVRAYYHEVMTKSLHCAEEILTLISEIQDGKDIPIGDVIDLNFNLDFIRPAFVKTGLTLHEDNSEQLLDRLMTDLIEEQLTTCAIFAMGHTIHHFILAGEKAHAN